MMRPPPPSTLFPYTTLFRSFSSGETICGMWRWWMSPAAISMATDQDGRSFLSIPLRNRRRMSARLQVYMLAAVLVLLGVGLTVYKSSERGVALLPGEYGTDWT